MRGNKIKRLSPRPSPKEREQCVNLNARFEFENVFLKSR